MISKTCDGREWECVINPALFAIKCSTNKSQKYCPFFLLHGCDPQLPIDFLLGKNRKYYGEEHHRIVLEKLNEAFKQVQQNVKLENARQRKYHDRNTKLINFEPGDPVKFLTSGQKDGYPITES